MCDYSLFFISNNLENSIRNQTNKILEIILRERENEREKHIIKHIELVDSAYTSESYLLDNSIEYQVNMTEEEKNTLVILVIADRKLYKTIKKRSRIKLSLRWFLNNFVSVKCERTETKALYDNPTNRNFRNNPKFIWRSSKLLFHSIWFLCCGKWARFCLAGFVDLSTKPYCFYFIISLSPFVNLTM